MKKKIILLFIMLLIITGCAKKYKLIINEENTSDYTLLYKYENGKKIYTKFREIKFNDRGNYISLEEALQKRLISIDDIISQMKYKDLVNDGGSMIYENNKKSGNLSDSSFIIVKCNTLLDNNQNIIIGKYFNIISKCHERSE